MTTEISNTTEEQKLTTSKNTEYSKRWRLKNPEYLHIRIQCDCGATYTRNNRIRHMNSQRHKETIAIIQKILDNAKD